MLVLLTGGAGFIGRAVQAAAPKGWNFRVYDLVHGEDLLDREMLRLAVEKCDLVINLAGEIRVPRSQNEPLPYWRNNTIGAAHLFTLCREFKKKCIHISSIAVAERHEPSHYAASKRAAEEAALLEVGLGADIRILRLFNPYGVGQPLDYVIPLFFQQMRAGGTITIHGDGRQRKDYIDVRDVASAIVAAELLPNGTIADCGTGVRTDLRELTEAIGKALDIKPRISFVITTRSAVSHPVADLVHLRAAGWNPKVTLREGLKHYANTLTS